MYHMNHYYITCITCITRITIVSRIIYHSDLPQFNEVSELIDVTHRAVQQHLVPLVVLQLD